MSKESYVKGFCKAAEAAGVDPHALAKYAQSVIGNVQPPEVHKGLGNIGKAAIRTASNATSLPSVGRPVGTWLKKLMSSPGPRQYAVGGIANSIPGTVRDYGGYGDARAYEDGYEAFQGQQ